MVGSGGQTKLSRLEVVVGSRRPPCCLDCSTLRDVKVNMHDHDENNQVNDINVEDFEDRIDKDDPF